MSETKSFKFNKVASNNIDELSVLPFHPTEANISPFPLYSVTAPPEFKYTFRRSSEINRGYLIALNVANALNDLITQIYNLNLEIRQGNNTLDEVRHLLIEELENQRKNIIDNI